MPSHIALRHANFMLPSAPPCLATSCVTFGTPVPMPHLVSPSAPSCLVTLFCDPQTLCHIRHPATIRCERCLRSPHHHSMQAMPSTSHHRAMPLAPCHHLAQAMPSAPCHHVAHAMPSANLSDYRPCVVDDIGQHCPALKGYTCTTMHYSTKQGICQGPTAAVRQFLSLKLMGLVPLSVKATNTDMAPSASPLYQSFSNKLDKPKTKLLCMACMAKEAHMPIQGATHMVHFHEQNTRTRSAPNALSSSPVADPHRRKEVQLHLLLLENALEVATIAPSALSEGVGCAKKNLLREEEDDF
ncbi:unnamed protein product [Prunus armeniaca]